MHVCLVLMHLLDELGVEHLEKFRKQNDAEPSNDQQEDSRV